MPPEVSTRLWKPERPIVTKAQIAKDLRSLSVSEGDVVMVHTSMKSLGWVIGGADAIVLALLDAVGPAGTIVATTGSVQKDTWHGFDRWPKGMQDAYLEQMPVFQPTLTEATPDVGRLPERIRTWPGAVRSSHPESSLVALGAKAQWLMEPHPLDFPSGEGSPLARLVEADGKVLMLGAPLDTITLLHHAETMASAPDKRIVHYPMPILRNGEREWVTVTDIDSSDGAYDYTRVGEGDAFALIGQAALDDGIGVTGSVGDSTSHLFSGRELVAFGIAWIDERFGGDDA